MDQTLEKSLIQKAYSQHIPLTVNFELLPLCNMNCDMCYIHLSESELLHLGNLLSVNTWIDFAKNLIDNGTLFILLTGGEPLLFPDFKKLYTTLHKMGFIITLNSNGTLINSEWADFFKYYPPRRINITLYGSNDETYNKLCHYPNGFTKTINAIKLLKERDINIKISASLTKLNQNDFEDIYKIGNKLSIPVFTDTYMLPGRKERHLPLSMQSRLSPKDAALMDVKIMQMQMPINNFITYIKNIINQIDSIKTPKYSLNLDCQAGLSSCVIDWQGMLRPCVTLEKPSISLLEYNFKDAWNILYNESKKLQLNKKCSTCNLRIICQTCAGNCSIETGHCSEISDYLCAYSKELYQLYKNILYNFETLC